MTAAIGYTGFVAQAPDVDLLRAWRAELRQPARLAVDAANRVYVADAAGEQLVVRDEQGRVVVRHDGLGRPLSVTVDGAGQVWVGDEGSGSVTAYDAAWNPAVVLGQGAGEFVAPTGIAVHGATGRIYVSDGPAGRVRVYDAAGAGLFDFDGLDGMDRGLMGPAGIVATADAVYVVSEGSREVCRFDIDGAFESCFGEPGDRTGELYAPRGLFLDASDRFYVTDARLGRVLVFDIEGNWLDHIGEIGQAPGLFQQPSDVVIDGHGRLFVASAENQRVEMFGLDGYTDPELYAPAEVTVAPARIKRGASGVVRFVLDVPGYRLDEIDLGSITVAGVAPSFVDLEHADIDPALDLVVEVQQADLFGALPTDGPQTVELIGPMATLTFHGTAVIEILPEDFEDTGWVVGGGAGRRPGVEDPTEPGEDGRDRPEGCACAQASGVGGWVVLPAVLGLAVGRRRWA